MNPRHYVLVPVWLWPVLFLRLWALHAWQVHTDRTVIFAITSDAQILVRYIEDDQADLSAWIARNQYERPHLAAMDNANGALQVSPIVIFIANCLEHFGCFLRYVSALLCDPPKPPILDSS